MTSAFLDVRAVPVEPEPGSFNLDPGRIEAALTSRTRAILPVHLYGRPAELDSILDSLQAAVLRVKLRHLDAWNARRKEIAGLYLGSIDNPQVQCPSVPEGTDHVWHVFVVRASDRDRLRDRLNSVNGARTLRASPARAASQG